MNLLKYCRRICVGWEMLVLDQYLLLAPRTFPVETHDVSEERWAYLCSVGYDGTRTNIWHRHHTYSQSSETLWVSIRKV